MAIPIVLPKQGQSVESCILVAWKVQVGDLIAQGDVLCEVETDKAVLEVESSGNGTVLALFFQPGDEVAVLTTIAAIGKPGEDISLLRPETASMPAPVSQIQAPSLPMDAAKVGEGQESQTSGAGHGEMAAGEVGVSPRARHLAVRKVVDLGNVQASGPGGRIIERDVVAALSTQPRLTPVAKAMVAEGSYAIPTQGSGPGGRIMARDLDAAQSSPESPPQPPLETLSSPSQPETGAKPEEVHTTPLKGVRRVIADRMLASLQTTAQLTLNSSADARALQAYRQKLKTSDEMSGLQAITINDLLLFAVSRVLLQHLSLNALFRENAIHQVASVHLGFAVDTPRGLLVPVLRDAQRRSLRDLAAESKRLAAASLANTIKPDEMAGATFTVTNLGNLGIESFTPILNPPQVAILGVGAIQLKPIEEKEEVRFVPHLHLSLTINHQVVDGAPGARFLQALAHGLAQFEMLLAY